MQPTDGDRSSMGPGTARAHGGAKATSRIVSLDGLRGVAVALVVVYHYFDLPLWMGVDIFFVLSGYLITTILLAERNDHGFWKNFYLRRVTRLAPSFVLMLLATALLGVGHWSVTAPYIAMFAANVGVVRHPQVFAASQLALLWSLAVEEHFYFVWPGLVRTFSRRVLCIILGGIIALEPVLRVIAGRTHDWVFTYFLTPFRLDGLACGALIAIAIQHPETRELLGRCAGPIAALGLIALAACMPRMAIAQHKQFHNAVVFSLLAVTFAGVLAYLLTADAKALPARALGWPPLTWLGRVSYGVYLYHFAIFLFVQRLASRPGMPRFHGITEAAILLTLLAAWVSFHYIEAPIIEWGKRRAGRNREERSVLASAKH